MAEMHSQACASSPYELVPNILRYTRKLAHPRHMNSFRIFYDIQSITYKYFPIISCVAILKETVNDIIFYGGLTIIMVKIIPYIVSCKRFMSTEIFT